MIYVVSYNYFCKRSNKNGILTVSAESAYLKGKNQATPAAYTASNTDNAKTTSPIYAITKSATTNLNNKTFDATNASSFIDYTITVKNEGTAAGTAVRIVDNLPAGLVAITDTSAANYKAPTTTGGTSNVTPVFSNAGKTVTVTGQDIAIGQTITVTFRAKKDASTIATGTSITNYAVVRDSTRDNDAFDLVDSSGDAADTSTTEKNYEDPATSPNLGKDNNTQATVTTTNQTRALAITTGVNKEVALVTSGSNAGNTYIYTITNNGTDIIEAATANAVKLSVKPTATATTGLADDPNISITRVFVDVNNDGVYNDGDIILTVGADGNYDLNQARPAGIASGAANAIKIGVEVATNGTGSNAPGGTNNIGNFETLTVAVLPQGPVNNTSAPANVNTTSTTTIQGINLKKFQFVADCSTTIPAVNSTNWTQANTTANAGQCIFYRLEVKNTFTEANKIISNVAITDTLVNTLAYQSATFVATPSSTADQTSGQDVKATFATLNPGATANIRFSAKPSQSGTN